MAIKQNDPYQSNLSDDEILRRRALQYDNELQPDPELGEGPAGGGRIALFAIAFIAILGVVFYGLNNPSTTTTTPTAQVTPVRPAPGPDTAATRPPAGTTTGSATTPASPTPVVPTTPSDPAMAPAPSAPAPSSGTSTSPSSN